jgi:hypothetical protein
MPRMLVNPKTNVIRELLLAANVAGGRIWGRWPSLLFCSVLTCALLNPTQARAVDLGNGNLSANTGSTSRNSSPNDALKFPSDGGCIGFDILASHCTKPRVVSELDHAIASGWAMDLRRENTDGTQRETESPCNNNWFTVLYPVECDCGDFRAANQSVIDDKCRHTISNERAKTLVAFYQRSTDSSITSTHPHVIEWTPAVSSEGKVLSTSFIEDLTGIKLLTFRDDTGIRSDENRVPYDFDGNFSGVNSSREHEKEKTPTYVRITALTSDTSGYFSLKTLTSSFEIRNIDVDASFDGETWFHMVGPKCIQRLPPFEADR